MALPFPQPRPALSIPPVPGVPRPSAPRAGCGASGLVSIAPAVPVPDLLCARGPAEICLFWAALCGTTAAGAGVGVWLVPLQGGRLGLLFTLFPNDKRSLPGAVTVTGEPIQVGML